MDDQSYKIRLQKIEEELNHLKKREEDVTCSDELLDFEKVILAEIHEKMSSLEEEKERVINYKEF